MRFGASVSCAFPPQPKPVAPLSADSEGRDLEEREAVALACGREQSRPGPEVEDPVYMNVAGNFACLLLDDDVLKPVSEYRQIAAL